MMRLTRSGGVTAAAVVLLSMASTARAQQGGVVITGKVTTEQGVPLTGANVFITELNLSVGTAATGTYTLTVPAARVSGQTLQVRVRSVGFRPESRPVTLTAGSRTTVDFTLNQDALRLSEVVVTGVSAATEAVKVPFAATHIDSSAMPVVGPNALQQLQGKVPSANIVQSGLPGSSPSIVMRGITSLNATGRSQSPLYIVDGIMLQDATGNGTRGGLPDLNPADIESIEVVPGAAAASLYGPRAGTGVINITTKKGRSGDTGVHFGLHSEVGAGDIERRWPIAKYSVLGLSPDGSLYCSKETVGGSPCARYIDMAAEAKRVNDQPLEYSLPPQLLYKDFGISTTPSYAQLTGLYQANPYTTYSDPINQLISPSLSATTQLDARGAIGSGNFYGSVANNTSQGAIRYLSGYRRNDGRLNVDQRVGDKVQLGMQTYYARTWNDGANVDNGTAWFNITRSPGFVDLTQRDQFGRLYIRSNPTIQGQQNSNPAYALDNLKQINTGGRFLGGLNARYNPVDWLTFSGQFGYDRSQTGFQFYRDRGARATTQTPSTSLGAAETYSLDNQSLNSQIGASIHHTLFKDLEATLNGSYTYNQRTSNDVDASGSTIVVPGLYTLNAATDGYGVSSTGQMIQEIGYLGNVNLTYKDRYVIDGALRDDGSSLFGPDQRWHTFGRISGTWIASEEPWWFAKNALRLFKLRANYGKAGVSPAFNEQYETYTIGTGGTLNPATLGNKDLRPEVKTDVEIGTDFDLYGKAAMSLTWVDTHVDDQILQVKPPTASGFQNQWQNAGQLHNRTIEATLDLPLVSRRNLTWSSHFSFDKTVSRITKLYVPPYVTSVTASGNSYQIFQIRQGERIGTFYGNKMAQKCSDLPTTYASQCGGAGSAFQTNDQGFIVWTGAGNSMSEGITKNLWTTALPAAQAPYGVRANWGMPIVLRDSTGTPLFSPLGNGLPNFHLGVSQTLTFKRVTLYGLVDASVGQKVWNIAYQWSLGDFQSADEDQYSKTVETAKPMGYYWRRGPGGNGGSSGIGGFYDVVAPNSYSVEDGSYGKLRELSLNYRLGHVAVGNWTVGVVGRNLLTVTKVRGWDPETGSNGGDFNSAVLNPVVGYRFPNLRTFTLQLSSSF